MENEYQIKVGQSVAILIDGNNIEISIQSVFNQKGAVHKIEQPLGLLVSFQAVVDHAVGLEVIALGIIHRDQQHPGPGSRSSGKNQKTSGNNNQQFFHLYMSRQFTV